MTPYHGRDARGRRVDVVHGHAHRLGGVDDRSEHVARVERHELDERGADDHGGQRRGAADHEPGEEQDGERHRERPGVTMKLRIA